jgi:hypothetical protein
MNQTGTEGLEIAQDRFTYEVRADRRGGLFTTADREVAERFAKQRGSTILALPPPTAAPRRDTMGSPTHTR